MWQSKIYKSISGLAEFSLCTVEISSWQFPKAPYPMDFTFVLSQLPQVHLSPNAFNSICCFERSHCYLCPFFYLWTYICSKCFPREVLCKGRRKSFCEQDTLNCFQIFKTHRMMGAHSFYNLATHTCTWTHRHTKAHRLGLPCSKTYIFFKYTTLILITTNSILRKTTYKSREVDLYCSCLKKLWSKWWSQTPPYPCSWSQEAD